MYVLLRKVITPTVGTEIYIKGIDWVGLKTQWQVPYQELLKEANRLHPRTIDREVLRGMLSNGILSTEMFIFELPMWKVIDWTNEKNMIPVFTPLDVERLQYAIERGAKPINRVVDGTCEEITYFLQYDYCRAHDAYLQTHLVGERELYAYLDNVSLAVPQEKKSFPKQLPRHSFTTSLGASL